MYIFGGHAVTLHSAENIKSAVWKSVRGSVVTAKISFIQIPQQSYVDVPPYLQASLRSGFTSRPIPIQVTTPQYDLTPRAVLSGPIPSPQGPTIRPFVGGPLQIDLTQQGWFNRPSPAAQGAVPPATILPPQTDPTQLAAQIWRSLTSPPIIPNPLGVFFSIPGQFEERPTKQVWPSVVSGQTPPVINSLWSAPQSIDLTQQAVLTAPLLPPPLVSYALTTFYAAPQIMDFTQQGRFFPVAWSLNVVPPNLHRLVMDIDTGRIGLKVSTVATGSPSIVVFLDEDING